MKSIYIIVTLCFLGACQKGNEGFPNYMKPETFENRFVIYNNGDDSLSNVMVFSEMYFPYENQFEGVSLDSTSKTWNKYDSLVFNYDSRIYKGCKASMDIQLTYYYTQADSIPKTKKTSTFVIPFQVLDENKNGIKFYWPNDTIYFSKK